MMEFEFRDYLRSLHRRDGLQRFQERTVQNRVGNCKNVERYEGNLDQHFDKDQCRDLLQRLSYSTANHDTNRTLPTTKFLLMATSEPVQLR